MNKIVKIFLCALIFSLTFVQSKVLAANYLLESTPKVSINTNKEWIVKFNSALKKETVNSNNIVVADENGKLIPAVVSIGNSSDTIVISPRVSGYEPNKKYNLSISSEVQSALGRKLNKSLKMQFTTINEYSDGTSYENLPQIASLKFEYATLLSSQKQGFYINTKNGENTQYRIFAHSYSEDKEIYSELTNGYTSLSNGKITAVKTLKAGESGEKYKVIIYAKRTNVTGAHKDQNTDYDNYYVDYFRVVNSVSTSNNVSMNYNISLDKIVDTQKNLQSTPVFVEYSDMTNEASKNQLKYYLDPNNFMDDYGKYQFLKLSYTDGIGTDDLNNILKGKGVLEGKGQVFLDAAKASNINVAYLVSHAILETGNGNSLLANGGLKDSDGNYVNGQPVYNFFGIGAIDEDANYYGTKSAYDNGWFTPEAAIIGGAQWISSKYINNTNGKQDTLYKMRWNPDNPGTHQYATDIAWSYKQIPTIMKAITDIVSQAKDAILIFEIPQFK